MVRFCTNCGNEFSGDEMYCMQCGTKREMAQPAPQPAPVDYAPVNNEPAFSMPAADNNSSGKKGKNIKWFIIGGGVLAVVVVLLAVVLLTMSGGGYKEPVKRFVALLEGDSSVLADMGPEEYWEYVEDETNMDIDEIVDFFDDDYEERLEEWEEEYGENIVISYEILDEKELSESKLDNIRDGLEVDMIIEGDDDDESEEMDMYVAKIDGEWYRVSENGVILIN